MKRTNLTARFRAAIRTGGGALALSTLAFAAPASAQDNDPQSYSYAYPDTYDTAQPLVHPNAVANPKLMFERGNLIGTDNVVNAYSVPVTDSAGTITYYDLVIKFTANSAGTVPTRASVTSVKSPIATSQGIVAGNYADANYVSGSPKGTCAVTVFALQSGRTESSFQCINSAGGSTQLVAVTGPVDTTHPYYTLLHAAGIDQRADVGSYFWGVVTIAGNFIGNCGGFGLNYPIGVQQNGDSIIVSTFTPAGAPICAPAINKLP